MITVTTAFVISLIVTSVLTFNPRPHDPFYWFLTQFWYCTLMLIVAYDHLHVAAFQLTLYKCVFVWSAEFVYLMQSTFVLYCIVLLRFRFWFILLKFQQGLYDLILCYNYFVLLGTSLTGCFSLFGNSVKGKGKEWSM